MLLQCRILYFFQLEKCGIIYYLIIYVLKSYSYSLNLLLIKYINEIYFINIYLLGGINGLFELIFEMIYYIIKIPEIILFDQQYYYIILMVIIYIIFNYLFYFIVNKYEPIYSLLCDMIPEIVIFNILGEYYSIGELIIFIILIFFIMVYLEIIQLNFCGLNTNLKTNIKKRGRLDLIDRVSKISYDIVGDLIRNLNV